MNQVIAFMEKASAFEPCSDEGRFCPVGKCWKIVSEVGKGYYWIFNKENLFNIKIHDFEFYNDQKLSFQWPKSLSISYYESSSIDEINKKQKILPGQIKTFIGGDKKTVDTFIVHKDTRVHSVGIEIMPAFYKKVLKESYLDSYQDLIKIFSSLKDTFEFPKMRELLKQVEMFRGNQISAPLFFEGKVLEALGLLIEYLEHNKDKVQLNVNDSKNIIAVNEFIDENFTSRINNKQLESIACMSSTKLKKCFKIVNGCTITEYIQNLRIEKACFLLKDNVYSIGQIAKKVGYTSASRFSELFFSKKGILPSDFKKNC